MLSKYVPASERLALQIDKTGGADACWPWTGAVHGAVGKLKYGRLKVKGKNTLAHRFAFEIAGGAVPAGLVVRHKCDNSLCCNPAHLELGTGLDNVRDRVERGRSSKGASHPKAKLTEEQARELRRLLAQKVPLLRLSRLFGIDRASVRAIRDGKNWAHLQ